MSSEQTPIRRPVREAFEFLEREHGFSAKCDDFGIEYESAKLKISVTWYRDPSVLFSVKRRRIGFAQLRLT
jgi:hypothetical protein